MIESERVKAKNLTIHICSGKLSAAEVMAEVTKLYTSNPTRYHLWDLVNADVSAVLSQDLRAISARAKKLAPSRLGSRTALVASQDLAFGLSRMYQIFAEDNGQGVEVRVFRSREQAEDWFPLVDEDA